MQRAACRLTLVLGRAAARTRASASRARRRVAYPAPRARSPGSRWACPFVASCFRSRSAASAAARAAAFVIVSQRCGTTSSRGCVEPAACALRLRRLWRRRSPSWQARGGIRAASPSRTWAASRPIGRGCAGARRCRCRSGAARSAHAAAVGLEAHGRHDRLERDGTAPAKRCARARRRDRLELDHRLVAAAARSRRPASST